MKQLVAAVLLLALAGASRADGAATQPPEAGAEKSGTPAAGKRGTAKVSKKETKRKQQKQADPAAASPVAPSGAKAAEKPCEPVKPCPID